MVLVGAVILPHGAMPFDGDVNSKVESCRNRLRNMPSKFASACQKLYEGSFQAAQMVADMNPDVIILHSPHGITLSHSMAVYVNSTAKGTALWNGEWSEFKVEVESNVEMAKELVGHLNKKYSTEEVMCFSDMDAVLRWGEAIPLWYLIQALGHRAKDVKFVIMTSPRRPTSTKDPYKLEQDKLDRGAEMYKYLEQRNERVVMAVSGDLSHTYETDCKDPLYLPDSRSNLAEHVNHTAATNFETAVKSWASGQTDSSCSGTVWEPSQAQAFLSKCCELQPKALSCGIGGFILLHGMIASCINTSGSIFRTTLTTCEAPTYYGMMAAVFQRSSK